MSFFRELKRRNVVRAVIAYVVGGWLVLQGMDLFTEMFEAPDLVMKVFVGAIALGLLPVIVFSWMFEITPEGIKREADLPDHPPASQRKLDMTTERHMWSEGGPTPPNGVHGLPGGASARASGELTGTPSSCSTACSLLIVKCVSMLFVRNQRPVSMTHCSFGGSATQAGLRGAAIRH